MKFQHTVSVVCRNIHLYILVDYLHNGPTLLEVVVNVCCASCTGLSTKVPILTVMFELVIQWYTDCFNTAVFPIFYGNHRVVGVVVDCYIKVFP